MQFVFRGSSFAIVFVDERFMNALGPVRRWLCTWFDTERWSDLSYKRTRSWFRTAVGKWNGIKCLCFVFSRCSSARHSLAPPMVHLQELCFFRRESQKLYLSFIDMIKLKTFWRYEGCSTTLQVLKINMRLGETVCVMPTLSAKIHCAKALPPKEGSVCPLNHTMVCSNSYSKFLCCVKDRCEIFLVCGFQQYTSFSYSMFSRWRMKKQNGNASICFELVGLPIENTVLSSLHNGGIWNH